MLRQVQKKRQFFCAQCFKHGKHIAAGIGVEEIIAVGDALGDAVQRLKRAERIIGEQGGDFAVGNAGIDGHVGVPEKSAIIANLADTGSLQRNILTLFVKL